MRCTFKGVIESVTVNSTVKCPDCGKYQVVDYTKRFLSHEEIKRQHDEPSWQRQPDGSWQWQNVHVTFDHSVLDVEYREFKEDPATGKIKMTKKILQQEA
jgi:hypothetical protein